MLDNIEKIYSEPLYKHSTFKIGGNARVAYFPKNKKEFIRAFSPVFGVFIV